VLQRLDRARIAGLCYLTVIAGGLFAEAFARGTLIVPGDAGATASAIAGDEALWRWGLAVHLLYLLPALAVNLLVYELLKPAQATLARLALACAVTSVAVEAVSLLQLYAPVVLLDEGGALAAFDDGQRQALAYLAVRVFSAGFGIALAFFAGFCVLAGGLILRSALIARPIGALMVAAGACYLVSTLALILSPSLSDALFPAILLPCLVGELSLALWLVVKGVPADRGVTTGPR
jgi:hypothetical protein